MIDLHLKELMPSSQKNKCMVFACGCFAAGTVLGYALTLKLQKWNFFNFLIKQTDHVWPLNTKHHISAESRNIAVISTKAQFDKVLPSLKQDLEQVKLLGFDCEWTSTGSRKQPVALLQLATISGLCVLIQLSNFTHPLPSLLTDLLKNETILKVGVGCYEDGQKLFNDYGLVVNGCVDLRFLAQLDNTVRLQKLGLQSLALNFLNYKMMKSKDIQCSDWNVAVLTEKQINYAADDALVAVEIFSKLIANAFKSNSHLLRSSLLDALSKAMKDASYCYCQEFLDRKFKQKCVNNSQTTNKKKCTNTSRVKKSKYPIRKSVMYDNCKLEAPDGQLLATCDRKKADWYIAKELADLVCEEPYTVRLRFEPAGRPTSSSDYYLHDKENCCVVCKSPGPIVRKNIVPHEYRKHFPLEMKDHTSHDILPFCVSCHQRSGQFDLVLRNQLADEYGAPLGSVNAVQVLEDPERRSARSAGRALLLAADKIPPKRKSELEKILQDFYSVNDVTKDLVVQASQLETRYKNESYIPHGEKVVSTIFKNNNLKGVIEFERKWRKHFLEKMQPKYLPAFWSVDHNHRKVLLQSSPVKNSF